MRRAPSRSSAVAVGGHGLDAGDERERRCSWRARGPRRTARGSSRTRSGRRGRPPPIGAGASLPCCRGRRRAGIRRAAPDRRRRPGARRADALSTALRVAIHSQPWRSSARPRIPSCSRRRRPSGRPKPVRTEPRQTFARPDPEDASGVLQEAVHLVGGQSVAAREVTPSAVRQRAQAVRGREPGRAVGRVLDREDGVGHEAALGVVGREDARREGGWRHCRGFPPRRFRRGSRGRRRRVLDEARPPGGRSARCTDVAFELEAGEPPCLRPIHRPPLLAASE